MPSSRVSSLAPRPKKENEVVSQPAAAEPIRFAQDIKPLFRPLDRRSMRFAFDLYSYDDVTRHADAILARLRAGSMPCDGAWPAEQVATFQRWVTAGKQP
jgi:hypothetical protein